jgi:hypothetical protein
MADALLLEEPERFVARARKVLAAEIERKLLRTFERNLRVMSNAESPALQGVLVNETHAQN